MARKKAVVLTQLQSAARMSRTVLSRQLLNQGLYAGQDKIILTLAQQDGQSPGALAQRLGVKPPTITKTINRLASQGLLEKRPSDLDARRTQVFLTHAGEELIGKIEQSLRMTEERALQGIDKEDVAVFRRVLDKLQVNLSEGGGNSGFTSTGSAREDGVEE